MLLVIDIILFVLWLLGSFVFNLGALIHVALVVAVIFIIFWLLKKVFRLFGLNPLREYSRLRRNCECIRIPGYCLLRAECRGENMQGMKDENEKPKEEPKPDTREPARKGSYTIPVQMY